MCIISQRRSVNEIDDKNILIEIADTLFDEVIFRSISDEWLRAPSLVDAVNSNGEGFITKCIYAFEHWLKNMYVKRFIVCIRKKWGRVIQSKGRLTESGLSDLLRSVDAVLMDIHEEHKAFNNELMKALSEKPLFSIQHGISIQAKKISLFRGTGERKGVRRAYLYSYKERPYYRARYALSESEMPVVGIPRHDSQWINNIISSDNNWDNARGHILVISRPANTTYYPRDRKYKALQDIRRLAFEYLKRRVVVKLHPKEKREGLYEEVFGEDCYDRKWVYSQGHAFKIGQGALCAISLCSSSLIADMTVIGVPSIELFDFRDIPNYDYSNELKGENGDPVKSFRYWGLVLGANDYADLRCHVDMILSNRLDVVLKLQKRHNELFEIGDNVSSTVADDILSAMSL